MNLSGSGSGLSRLPSMGKSLQSLETFQQNLPPQQSQSKPPKNTKTIIIVVNVLPLVFSRDATNTGWDVEWNSTATAMFYRNLIADTDKYKSLYVGCPEVFVSKEEESMVEKQLRTLNCVPVFLDPLTAHRYYQGYCKGVLWPIFHNVVDVYNSASLTLDEDTTNVTNKPDARRRNSWCDPVSWNPGAQDKCWADYCSVNR
jgi:trehalose 6-phosphate synthase/phosphatase